MNSKREVYIVGGVRTPFLKFRGTPGPFRASDLGVMAMRDLLMRTNINTKIIDEAIVGSVAPRAEEANIARLISVRAGCEQNMPAWTVGRNCGSGMQAVDSALSQIQLGRSDIVIAGGVDALSRTHMILKDSFVEVMSGWMSSKSLLAKLKVLKNFRFHSIVPISSLVKGLCDPLIDQSMGATAENLVYKFNITRHEQDEFSLRSHNRLASAIDNNLLKDVITISSNNGNIYSYDDGVRRNTTMDDLAKLKPYFDKKFGSVTAGNSSQITDGAVMLLIASGDAIKKYNLKPRAKIIDCRWTALDPSIMGLGPAYSIPRILQNNNKTISDIDYWEINEAFSAQVIACLIALKSKEFCRQEMGLNDAVGEIPQDNLNIYGGAISCGHPLGASGARLLLHLMSALENNNGKLGIASQCIGGGQGGAMLIEKV
jgi:acetyl-CoA C-acetyltransferase